MRALARELLGPDFSYLADWSSSVSEDTPLVTVVGANLIAHGRLGDPAFANEPQFREAVLDKFVEEYAPSLWVEASFRRPILDLMAAFSPTELSDDFFLQPHRSLAGRNIRSKQQSTN